jgi:outer membrane receptor protein involved in Fe transport
LARNVPGVSLEEAQGKPFQPNLIYRGFTVSSLQGQAQGLAIYLDGARFNQPFGDTVQFDLLPQAAIDRLDLLHASPVYGLNALGGAMAVETRTGRSAHGVSGSASLGSYGASELTGEAGGSSLGADLQAASGQYLFGDEANLERRTHANVVANLRASVKVAGPLRLFGEVTNAFDRHYATYGTFSETDQIYLREAPGASDPHSLSPGAPRRWLMGLRVAF